MGECRAESVLDELPSVTIVMPVRNEAGFIRSSLDAVLAQDYPRERMELILIDGMSTDDTRAIIQQTLDRWKTLAQQQFNGHAGVSLDVRVLDNRARIVPSGLNRAIAQAKGEVIVRVDAHTIIAPDYVCESVAVMQRTGADVVGGRMTPAGKGWIGETIALAHNLRFGLGGALFHRANRETDADTVYMGVFRRDVFDRVGAFNEKLVRNQDIELNTRVRQGGGRVILSPRIRSTYFCRDSIRRLWKQNYTNGLWVLPTLSVTPGSLSLRHLAPLLFVVGLLSCGLMALVVPFGWVLLLLLAGSYSVASIVASITAARQHGWRFAISLPLIFIVLHLSYGVGSLVQLGAFIKNDIRQRFAQGEKQ